MRPGRNLLLGGLDRGMGKGCADKLLALDREGVQARGCRAAPAQGRFTGCHTGQREGRWGK